jgi:hypothetical protein
MLIYDTFSPNYTGLNKLSKNAFVLADLYKSNETYKNFYKNHNFDRLILDNGCYDSETVTNEELYNISKEVNATYVIAPDSFKKPGEKDEDYINTNFQRYTDYLKYIVTERSEAKQYVMYVLHSSYKPYINLEIMLLKEFQKSVRFWPTIIAIPKRNEDKTLRTQVQRQEILEDVLEQVGDEKDENHFFVHILGEIEKGEITNNQSKYNANKNIISMDTTHRIKRVLDYKDSENYFDLAYDVERYSKAAALYQQELNGN